MATFRVYKESGNFVTVHKDFIHDNNISWKAKGILLYLLSRPDDWQIYETELTKHTSDGRDSLRTGIKELEEVGYIKRKRKRDNKGQFKEYEYMVFEHSNHIGNSHVGESQLGNSHVGESNTTNNKGTNNDLTNNDSRVNFIPYKEIIEILNNETGKRFSYKSKANQKLIKARINEGYTKEDFIKVIKTKTTEWKDLDNMKGYLQPSTLFGNKFDKYLNQEIPATNKSSKDNIFSQILNEEA